MSSLLKRISGTLKDAVLQMFGLQAAFGSGTGEAKFCLPEPPRLSDKGKVMNKQMNGLRKTDSDFEQRGSIRRSINIPCALRIRGAVFLARLLDLSAGGAFVEFKDPPACGTEISLIFPVKEQKKVLDLDLMATVVYTGRFLQSFSNYYGFGVRFTNVSCEIAATLEEVLKEADAGSERKYILE